MGLIIAIIIAALAGYIYGARLRPDKELSEVLDRLKNQGEDLLTDGKKGVYRTVVTDQQKSSELTVEVKEVAQTQAGQVKVQYLSAYYQNPAFRTRKGEALLQEVHGLLGEYLPANEIEWYAQKERQERVTEFLNTLAAARTKPNQRT